MYVIIIRTPICAFSGLKLYPGHGSLYSRSDGKVLNFLNHKCRKYYKNKIKSVKVKWTLLYKRIRKNKYSVKKK